MGPLVLLLILEEKFSVLNILAVGMSHVAFVTLSAFPLSSSLLSFFFYHERMLKFVRRFFLRLLISYSGFQCFNQS